MQRAASEFEHLHEQFRNTASDLPLVLAIHGSASSGRQWRSLADQLSGAARVCAPDLPGYGSAARDTMDRLAVLGQVIRHSTGLINLVAHSFGGAVALRLAHEHPDRVASVTLYDPITADPDATGRHRLPGALDNVWQCYADGHPTELMSRFYDFWADGTKWANLQLHQQERLLVDYSGLYRDMTEITRGDWAIPQHTYRGPITVFRGQLSPRVTIEMAQNIAYAHSRTSVVTLQGMGHFAPLTQSQQLNAHLRTAIFENSAGVTAHAA